MILKLAFLLYILGDTGSNLCLNTDYSDKITVFFLSSFSHTEIMLQDFLALFIVLCFIQNTKCMCQVLR